MTGQLVAAKSTNLAVEGKPLSSAQLYLEQNICPCPNPAKAAATVVPRKQQSEREPLRLQNYQLKKKKRKPYFSSNTDTIRPKFIALPHRTKCFLAHFPIP